MAKKLVKDELAVRAEKRTSWFTKIVPLGYCTVGIAFYLLLFPVYADDIFATAKNAMQTVYTDVAGNCYCGSRCVCGCLPVFDEL